MKKVAILVIGALNQPVYLHYLRTYWSTFIKYAESELSSIDIYLLFERKWNLEEFSYINEHIIVDQNEDYNGLVGPKQYTSIIPGILSKTIYALELLVDHYDVFFRTNLSSMIHTSSFLNLLLSKAEIIYSGQGIWKDALRKDLIFHDRIGPDKSIKNLSELEEYPGNSFITGSGYFLGKKDVIDILENKHKIRYDIVDDVSIGLMIKDHEYIPNFTLKLTDHDSIEMMIQKLRSESYSHVRLQHMKLQKAQELWDVMSSSEMLESLIYY